MRYYHYRCKSYAHIDVLCYNTHSMGKRLLPAVQSPDVLDFISHSASQTERIGYRLGEHIRGIFCCLSAMSVLAKHS